MKKCENCGKEFAAKRKDAKFCSPACRKAYARKNNIDEKTGEIRISEPAIPKSAPKLEYDRVS